MSKYIIHGANKLSGEITVQGCKNSALAVLFACLTVDGETVISGLPDISDVKVCLEILAYYGCTVKYLDKTTVKIITRDIEYRPYPKHLTVKLRASSYLIGALMSRFGKCVLPESGGCDIGARPLNLHIDAIKALGAEENAENGKLYARNGLKGSIIRFPSKTVGGTVNAVIAASKADGVTVICNAAREPHISDLCGFLNTCGAQIYGAGDDVITVKGVRSLNGKSYRIDSDMIEAGTFMIAALATKGRVKCVNAPVHQLKATISALEAIGAEVIRTADSVTASADSLSATDIVTAPYPAFPTDLQPQISALLGISKGESHVHETVFENRFLYINELRKCGMDCILDENKLTVKGIKQYNGACLSATDLRGGAAMVIAALNANEKSVIDNVSFIERGYSSFHTKLASLGADIIKR
ncbi:MAG: UDP-N-acetylglucosamine 1-carboxyvinyltransferase [Clostridia bacterium]|nr:UDP-N-acetylglucosamine 1-carboxyvinyltransferase [Clostridia bacterium]